MELVMPGVLTLCFLGLAFVIQGSADVGSSRQVLPGPVSAPSLAVEPNVNFNNTASSPALSPSVAGKGIGTPVAAPSNERHDPISPAYESLPRDSYVSPTSAPTPSIVRKRDGMPSAAPPISIPGAKPPTSHSPTKESGIPFRFTPPPNIVSQRDGVPAAAPRNESPEPVPPIPPVDQSPIRAPSTTRKKGAMPAPPNKMPELPQPVDSSPIKEPDISPASTPSASTDWKRDEIPVAVPASRKFVPQRPANTSPIKAPPHNVTWKSDAMPVAAPPSKMLEPQPPMNHYPSTRAGVSPASNPPPSLAWRGHVMPSAAPVSRGLEPVHPMHHSPTKDTATSPTALPKSRRKHYAPAPLKPGSSIISSQSPITSPTSDVSPTPSLSPEAPSGHSKMPYHPPIGDSSGSSSRTPKPLPVVQALPPPPPNADCFSTTCTEPYTNSPPGSPCACVLPIQVALLLGIDLYTFFPLVSKLATEVSAGIFMKQSQVRIMGANAASQQLEKTIVLIDLVPLGKKFDATSAFLTFERFWHRKVPIKDSIFGDYEVLYLHYPGLPPSPPMAPSDVNIVDGGPYSGSGNNGRNVKPLGVDVQKRRYKSGLGGGVIAIIVLSATIVVTLLSGAAWVFLFNRRDNVSQREPPRALLSSLTKSSAAHGSTIESGASFASLSIESNIAPYTGSAKTFSTSDIETATDNYNPSRILGEGGFGRVYLGLLEDGTKVAVKVLKRDDQQGSREFLAEIEMLSRLHHRNLVKLIGICIEEQNRCLVYELIPKGSVESHLHGIDKETSPLDWTARIKIALGAARGLAYLHEDSSPRVIHRDFKSSNILLEDDFTPKVSDFGLARTAMDEENRHISTRVMGTFGYVAPEYAMTGHLLVKSDVYSYGVVLLELLTGKKPVDMSQAPGQENLVAWARPLLTSKEGLEAIIDPSLEPGVPFDSISKVAAIASMCVQPEVSNRPFMGEVVQALKLVCNECEESYEVDSRTSECEDLSIDMEASMSASSEQLSKHLHRQFSHSTFELGSDLEHRLSISDLLSTSTRLGKQEPGSFRRNSSSSPPRTGGTRQLWQKVRRLYGGSVSEHSTISKFRYGSH